MPALSKALFAGLLSLSELSIVDLHPSCPSIVVN